MGGRLCLVMGSEGDGISRLVRERCDFECKLPQRGRVESLNVAQAATVMCYEWLRRVSAEGQGDAESNMVEVPSAHAESAGRSSGEGFAAMDDYTTDRAASFDIDWDL